MEEGKRSLGENPRLYKDAVLADGRERVAGKYSVLTDAVLAELKRQAQDGCVLCSLDSLDEDECA